MNIRIETTAKPVEKNEKIIEAWWEEIDRKLYGSKYRKYEQHYINAYDGENVVGQLACEVQSGICYIDELIVHPDYRGHGIGTKLMQTCLDIAKQCECHKIYLETDPRLKAFEFYKKHGFETESVLKNHAAHLDAVIMSLYL